LQVLDALSIYLLFNLKGCSDYIIEAIGEGMNHKERLVECVKLYAELKDAVRQYERIFSPVILLQGFQTVITLGSVVFGIVDSVS